MAGPPAVFWITSAARGDRVRNLSLALSRRLRMVPICWIAVASVVYVGDLLRQTRDGLTNGAGRPFGDDFINYWSAAALAWHGRAADIYDWSAFHAFEERVVGAGLDFYHYSYPPVLPVLTAPLAVLGYVAALFVWLLAGWLCFFLALRTVRPERGVLLLALATPAVFISAVGGQNGTWTAAFLGGGLSLLERRPVIAGVLLGLLIQKPQLGLLLPVALLAAGHFRALTAAAITAAALVLASVLLFGSEIWTAYFHNAAILREAVLENGVGVWHRMVSVFVAARRLGVGVPVAYGVQAVIALAVAAAVALAWHRDVPAAAKNALLVVGTFLATPYLQDYDLVVGAFVVLWLAELYPAGMPKPVLLATGLTLIAPLAASPLANLTGYEFGPLLIVPVFVIVLRASLPKAPALAA
jgi:arabinofuranan 3-O-arabinosyltransferase